jgi:hypothetical protein
MRIPYYCPYCDQHSTRRWNLDVHIKRRHGGYLLGRSSGDLVSRSISYKPNYQYNNIGSATVADSIGNTFQPRRIPQQAPLGISQYCAGPTYRPLPTMDDQSYGTGLSRETIIRIDELKRLANKYPQYCPEGLMQWAIFCCNDGDNRILDDKLQQLRTIDRRLNGWS